MPVGPSIDKDTVAGDSARRLHLALMFSDLCGSSELAAHMEAEDYLSVLAAVRQACRKALQDHGGVVVRMQGDGLLAVFGWPRSDEDLGRRAVEAALEMRAALRALDLPASLGTPLRLHSGIHAGLTLVAEGDIERGRLDLLGETPNIAARLCELAAADEILVSETSLGPDLSCFSHGPRERLPLRGRRDALPCYRIHGLSPAMTRLEARVQRGGLPFTGRSAELEQLLQALHRVADGESQTVLVYGSGGLGKTRLCETLLDEARERGWQLHRGYCDAHLHTEPLQPWLQLLRGLFGQPRLVGHDAQPEVPDLASVLTALPVELGGQAAQWLLRMRPLQACHAPQELPSVALWLRRVRELFTALAAHRPQLLFLDDWQWADLASQQMLAALRELRDVPLLILVTSRLPHLGALQGPERLQALALEPLPLSATRQAIASLLPQADPFLAEQIHHRGGGNPLYIEELCHGAVQSLASRQRGVLDALESSDSAWLELLIEARVARLSDRQAALLRTAAVIGTVLPAWLLQELCGQTADEASLVALAEQDFLFAGAHPGELRFKHGITRDVVYQLIASSERRQLHRRIALILEARADLTAGALRVAEAGPPAAEGGEQHVESLAYHYACAQDWDAAARYAELAADRAVAASALDRAQHFYAAALDALDKLPAPGSLYGRRVKLLQSLGLACVFDPAREQLAPFRRGLALAREQGDKHVQAQALFWLAYVEYALGSLRPAIAHCEEALRLIDPMDLAPLRVQIEATLGQALAAAGEYERAVELLDSAISIKRAHRSGARPAVGSAYSLACKAAVLGDWGTFDEAAACFDEAMLAVRGAGHEVEASVLCLRSAVLLWQGRWADAAAHATQARAIAERVRSLYVFGMSCALDAYARWRQSGDPGALLQLQDASLWLESRDKHLFGSLNRGWLAEALVSLGRHEEARRHAAHALRRARHGDALGAAMALRALARSAAAGRGRRGAQHYLEQAQRIARRRGSLHEIALNRLCAAELALQRGDQAQARKQLASSVPLLERLGMTWHLAQASLLADQLQQRSSA